MRTFLRRFAHPLGIQVMNKKDLRQGHRRMRVEKELDFLRDVQDGDSPFVENTVSMFEVSRALCDACRRVLSAP